MPPSKSDVEKNIWVPASVLVGIQFASYVDPQMLRWSSIFLLFTTIFWCLKWLRLRWKEK